MDGFLLLELTAFVRGFLVHMVCEIPPEKWMQVFLLHLSPSSERVLEKMGARIQMEGSACGAYLV